MCRYPPNQIDSIQSRAILKILDMFFARNRRRRLQTIHCYEVTVVKVEIKIFGVTLEIFVSSASHICNAILTVFGKSSDLTVPGMWPLCYTWIGYLQANGSAVNPAI